MRHRLAPMVRVLLACLATTLSFGSLINAAPDRPPLPEIKEKVIDIIVDKTGVDRSKVTPKAKIVDDLRADELDLVEIIMAMEEEFSIKIADKNAEKLKTVQDFIDFISAGPDTNLKFSGTLSAEDQYYLGLEKPGPFTLQDIKAPYVLIEIMRTTCPHCVAQAPALNRLYHLVANSPLKYKVKLIVVGESSYGPTLKQFKATHNVPFPLVPDPHWEIGTALDIASTPTTLLLDKSGKVLLVEAGAFENADEVFQKIKAVVK